MNRRMTFWTGLAFICCLAICGTSWAQAPLTIEGVTDRSTYTDQVSLSVPSTTGYSYEVLLDGQRIPTDQSVTVARMDYHEVLVTRTNIVTLDVTNRLVRFIVLSSNRGSPEKGLMEWKPYPSVNSTAAEFAGAQLHVMAPADYPRGLRIPVIAWVDDGADRIRRGNGDVAAAGFEGQDFRIRRGHGSTTLNPALVGGALAYSARLHSLEANKVITVEDTTTWIAVSGTLGATTTWPENSRIHLTGNVTVPVGATLTVEAGTIIQANALVNINIQTGARMVINGTADRPVVLTAMGPVAPHQRTYAWGGFLIRGAGATLQANHSIFVGGGGAASFSFSPGDSHRSEQAVILVHSNAVASLTNCAIINTAGQVGNAWNSDLTYDHCLIQKAITCGEHVGGTIIVNKSALMEFPEENGAFSAQIADADYDGIYFTTGTHLLLDSFFGFMKDDAIDSGSGGAGTVLVTNCWVEAALHEALAWSGDGRQTWTYDTVLINNGQGIECGWSSSSGSPNCFADRLLSIGNSVGARFGDNYDWDYWGRLRITNSAILHNYRDAWGMNWDNWLYGIDSGDDRTFAMDIQGNYLTSVNTNHPNNTIWDPVTDGGRLAHWMTTPADAPVGIGLAVWANQVDNVSTLTNGVPVRLSSFTTQNVTVDYTIQAPGGPVASGTLTFTPGETVKTVYPAGVNVAEHTLLRVVLSNPTRGELTGITNITFGQELTVRFAVQTTQQSLDVLSNGVSLSLNGPAPAGISIGFTVEGQGGVLTNGTYTFAQGQTSASILLPTIDLARQDLVRVTLVNPGQVVLGGLPRVYFLRMDPVSTSVNTVLIANSAVWRYRAEASAAPATWNTLGFDDSAWPSGPAQLGFSNGEENDEATLIPDNNQITSYFRHALVVAEPAAYTNLAMLLIRDDGGVVYINGTEVFRSPNLPAGVISYGTTTLSPNGENTQDRANVSPTRLVAGTNLVAVEIHQQSSTSSDVSFALELVGHGAPPPPTPQHLRMAQFDGQVTLGWSDATYVLQEAASVTGPWTNVVSPSPVAVPVNPAVPQRFYRIYKP